MGFTGSHAVDYPLHGLTSHVHVVQSRFQSLLSIFGEESIASLYAAMEATGKEYRDPEDTVTVLGLILAWFLLYRLVNSVSRPLANRLLPLPTEGVCVLQTEGTKTNKGKSRELQTQKFTTSCWKFLTTSFFFVYGFLILTSEPWALDWTTWYSDYVAPLSPSAKLLYLMELTYYIHASVIIFWEPPLKDRAEMLTHHAVTFSLILFSYLVGLHRVGVVILVLHDFADPWMEVAKLFNYCKNDLGANICFVIFALAFWGMRLVVYPAFAVYATIFHGFFCVESCTTKPVYTPMALHGMFCLLLLVLQGLHIFWGFLIAKMMKEAILESGVKGDIREEKDE